MTTAITPSGLSPTARKRPNEATSTRGSPSGPVGHASSPSAAAHKAAIGAAPDRVKEATGDGGGLSVTNLNKRPQPAWARDIHSTQQHLQANHPASHERSTSPAKAQRMYRQVEQS